MRLDEAPSGYDLFMHKEDECMKIVLKADGRSTYSRFS
jgi:threonine dehydrogenase-like Zn-dependent dehydrogenase